MERSRTSFPTVTRTSLGYNTSYPGLARVQSDESSRRSIPSVGSGASSGSGTLMSNCAEKTKNGMGCANASNECVDYCFTQNVDTLIQNIREDWSVPSSKGASSMSIDASLSFPKSSVSCYIALTLGNNGNDFKLDLTHNNGSKINTDPYTETARNAYIQSHRIDPSTQIKFTEDTILDLLRSVLDLIARDYGGFTISNYGSRYSGVKVIDRLGMHSVSQWISEARRAFYI